MKLDGQSRCGRRMLADKPERLIGVDVVVKVMVESG